jgi:hypothetical protein
MAGGAGLALFTYFMTESNSLFVGGIVLAVLLTLLQWRKKIKPRADRVASES